MKNFSSLIDKKGACWLWKGTKDKDGYGRFTISRKEEIRAHRLSYMLFVGPIPEGMFVCHKCDNPSCVKPAHLWLGTVQDNHKDMDQKKRRVSVSGTRHGMAKLDGEKVRQIRALYRDHGFNQREIAENYNISREMVGRIIRRQNWK